MQIRIVKHELRGWMPQAKGRTIQVFALWSGPRSLASLQARDWGARTCLKKKHCPAHGGHEGDIRYLNIFQASAPCSCLGGPTYLRMRPFQGAKLLETPLPSVEQAFSVLKDQASADRNRNGWWNDDGKRWISLWVAPRRFCWGGGGGGESSRFWFADFWGVLRQDRRCKKHCNLQ